MLCYTIQEAYGYFLHLTFPSNYCQSVVLQRLATNRTSICSFPIKLDAWITNQHIQNNHFAVAYT